MHSAMKKHVPIQHRASIWFSHTTHVDYSCILPYYSGIKLVARISSEIMPAYLVYDLLSLSSASLIAGLEYEMEQWNIKSVNVKVVLTMYRKIGILSTSAYFLN